MPQDSPLPTGLRSHAAPETNNADISVAAREYYLKGKSMLQIPNLEAYLNWVKEIPQHPPGYALEASRAFSWFIANYKSPDKLSKINTLLEMDGLTPIFYRQAYQSAVEFLLTNDREKLVSFSLQIPENESDLADQSVMGDLSHAEAQAFFDGLADSNQKWRYTNNIRLYIDHNNESNGEGIANWVNDLPESKDKIGFLTVALSGWSRKNEAAAREWAKKNVPEVHHNKFAFLFPQAR